MDSFVGMHCTDEVAIYWAKNSFKQTEENILLLGHSLKTLNEAGKDKGMYF